MAVNQHYNSNAQIFNVDPRADKDRFKSQYMKYASEGVNNPNQIASAFQDDGTEVNPYMQKRKIGKKIFLNHPLVKKERGALNPHRRAAPKDLPPPPDQNPASTRNPGSIKKTMLDEFS